MEQDHRTIIGVQRASGGLGSSTLAAAVAAVAAEAGRVCLLVDLAPHGGGLDQLVGCGHEPGARWPASGRAVRRGDAGQLSAESLPSSRGVRVLSHRLTVPPPRTLEGVAVQTVVRLARAHQVTVLDLPSPDHPRAVSWWHLCDTVVLLTGSSPSHVAAALVVRSVLPRLLGVISRPSVGGGLSADDVADVLGSPLLGVLEDDPDAVRALLEQRLPGSEPGALRDMAATVLCELDERRGRGAAA